MDWKDQTFSLKMLEKVAKGDDNIVSMVDWLKHIGVIPKDAEWKRRNALTRTNLNGDAIPAGYLAELAFDWDQDGESMPIHFVESLEYEVNGTDKHQNVSDVLGSLGRADRPDGS